MTPEYRKSHLAHCRAYDVSYHAVNRERENLLDRANYWLNPNPRRARVKAYYAKNREKIERRVSVRLCAEDMIAEALT